MQGGFSCSSQFQCLNAKGVAVNQGYFSNVRKLLVG